MAALAMGLCGCAAADGELRSEARPASSISGVAALIVPETAVAPAEATAEQAPAPPKHVVSVVAAEVRGCAIFDNGMMQCWGGFNFDGELGLGNTKEAEAPGWVQGIHGVTQVALSKDATCAIHNEGQLSCWGRKVGSGTMDNDDVLTPTRVAGVGKLRDVALSDRHACAVEEAGSVFCWGESQDGQLGIGDEKLGAVRRAPQRVSGLADVRGVLALPRGTAAWTAAGQLYIWGRLGGPDPVTTFLAPRPVTGLADVTRAWASGQQICALRRNTEVRCFDSETLSAFEAGKQLDVSASLGPLIAAGQKRAIAKGKKPKSLGPLLAPDGRGVSGVVDVAVFNHDASALTKDGAVYSWGSATRGTVGQPTHSAGLYPPTRIQGIDGAVALTGSFMHRCALDGAGVVRCFGKGGAGRLGTDSTKESLTAVVVAGLPKIIAIAANSHCTFAIGQDHSLWTWGSSWVHSCGLPGNEATKAPALVPLQPTSSAPR